MRPALGAEGQVAATGQTPWVWSRTMGRRGVLRAPRFAIHLRGRLRIHWLRGSVQPPEIVTVRLESSEKTVVDQGVQRPVRSQYSSTAISLRVLQPAPEASLEDRPTPGPDSVSPEAFATARIRARCAPWSLFSSRRSAASRPSSGAGRSRRSWSSRSDSSSLSMPSSSRGHGSPRSTAPSGLPSRVGSRAGRPF